MKQIHSIFFLTKHSAHRVKLWWKKFPNFRRNLSAFVRGWQLVAVGQVSHDPSGSCDTSFSTIIWLSMGRMFHQKLCFQSPKTFTPPKKKFYITKPPSVWHILGLSKPHHSKHILLPERSQCRSILGDTRIQMTRLCSHSWHCSHSRPCPQNIRWHLQSIHKLRIIHLVLDPEPLLKNWNRSAGLDIISHGILFKVLTCGNVHDAACDSI